MARIDGDLVMGLWLSVCNWRLERESKEGVYLAWMTGLGFGSTLLLNS
jgi:hypothetical protein